MNVSTIIFLATVLYGLCGCQAGPVTPSPDSREDVFKTTGEVNVPSLQLIWDQARKLLPQDLLTANNLPRNVIRRGLETMYHELRNIDLNDKAVTESVVARMKVLLVAIWERLQNMLQWPKRALDVPLLRRRRSLLTSPIETMRDVIQYATDSVQNRVQSTQAELWERFWNFIRTTGLPWTHRFLDDLAATKMLPAPVDTLIKDFDAGYELLKLLGVVKV